VEWYSMKIIFPTLTFMILSCSMFEYNPNDFELEENEQNLTAKNLTVIAGQIPGDTVLLILAGDTQRFYEDTRDFVSKVNSRPRPDFVVISGDISDFGLPAEFKWMNKIYSSLHAPYLTVIGNHDLIGSGRYVYDEMFGPADYSFTYGRYKFIMANTNGREFGFNGSVPDTAFLKEEYTGDNFQKILLCHVSPGDPDFDPALNDAVEKIIRGSNLHVGAFHGHHHGHAVRFPFGPDLPFVSTSSTSQRNYLEVRFFPTDNRTDTFNTRQIYY
jgi:3',5'-cyclic-AMP phosphodiesterase